MKYAYTATGYIIDESKKHMLLIVHDVLGKWTPVGGHIEENELPDVALLREIKEETGLTGEILPTSIQLNLSGGKAKQLPNPYCILDVPSGKDDDTHYCDFRYIVKADKESKLSLTEVLDAKWFTKEEILNMDIYPSVKEVARNLLQ